MSSGETNEPRVLPVGEALAGFQIAVLPEGTTARGLLALVKLDESDGGIGWAVRVTEDLNDEEVLGVLVGYVEHLKKEASDSWDDADPTRAQG